VPGGNTIWYGYDSANQRVYQGTYNPSTATYSNEQIYFYGADGKKLGCWSLTSSGSTVTLTATTTNIWFAGRLLTPEDRLQSIGRYFPFGEDRTFTKPVNPANDQEKFATYTRDSATLLDYAYQCYYNSQLGRFQTVDPDGGTTVLHAPQSLNRYGYAIADPVNKNDPTGLDREGSTTLDWSVTTNDLFGFTTWWPMAYCELLAEDQAHAKAHGAPPPNSGNPFLIPERGAAELLYNVNCASLFLAPGSNTLDDRKTLSKVLDSVVTQVLFEASRVHQEYRPTSLGRRRQRTALSTSFLEDHSSLAK
jgi:RHS repeat-associated protein